jgi:hypothetical protein
MKTLYRLFAVALLALGLGLTPAAASVDAPASVESVDRPAHNETTLSLFSCAVGRSGTGHPNMTINHSHRIAADSITGKIDAFDCEGYDNPGLDGCVFRMYYHYGNKLDGTDLGIVGPTDITCFGF